MTALASSYRLPDERYAVVLNANAGRVTEELTASIRTIIPPDRVFLTRSPEHAREVLRSCVESGVRTVFAGGGDGTIVGVINALDELRRSHPQVPEVAILRLGTGNALAHWLGSGLPVADLARWRSGAVHRAVTVPMVEAEGTLFPFGGLGHDAAVLNDYNRFKKASRGRWWRPLTFGLLGYLLAAFTRTIPNYLMRDPVRVRVINLGAPAVRLGTRGEAVGATVAAGELLYEGPASMVGCATTPMFGYGMRMFPWADARVDRFQLRVLNMGAIQSAANLWPAWQGRLDHPGRHDFHVDRVRVVFDGAMPYQVGGEAQGYRKELVFGLGAHAVTLIARARDGR